ncbi:MAG: META domain-containing protein, partial [Terriglobia bacterium]
ARVTLTLGENNRAHGIAAVNLYAGSFRLGDEDRIGFDPHFATTRMAGPPELMQLEAQYLEALARATRLRASRGEVVLENDDKTVLLGFRTAPWVFPSY